MLRSSVLRLFILLVSALTLASCGGGGSTTVAGIGGTGITASGSITGFGSIYVNGVHFDVSGAAIHVNGTPVTESSLKLGMIVTVRGILNSNGIDATASTVDYKTELEGPIATSITTSIDGASKTFTVLGRTILVKQNYTIFDGFTFDTIASNDVVEISGLIDATGQLVATHIKKEGTTSTTSSVELKGTVANFNGTNQFDITVNSQTYTVKFSTTSVSISNGMNVRVKGALFGNTITATEIEVESSPFTSISSSDKASLEGIITNLNTNSKTFTINGQAVDYSNATVPSGLILANGVHVEVEGMIINSVLQVSQFEARDGDLEISSVVQSVDLNNNTITLQFHSGYTVTVAVSNITSMDDETKVVSRMKITDISAGDFLEIDARDNSGTLLATSIHRKLLQSGTLFKLEGSVSGFNSNPGSESITVLGVTFTTDNQTTFQINDATTSRINFFNTIKTGSTLKIKDNQNTGVSDGVAVEMDLTN